MTTFLRIALALAAALAAVPTAAQQYPTKAIRLIVPFGAGTPVDILGRLVGTKLSETFGQPIVTDNRPGASGVIGTEMGARAAPDGYTLLMVVSGTLGINPALHPKLSYDPVKDFAPIAHVANIAQTLIVNPKLQVHSTKELIEFAKSKQGQLSYASLGAGSTSHLTMEMFRSRASFQATNIPFKGSAEADTQVMNGEIPFMFESMPAVLPHIKSGKLRALAVSTAQRSPFLPNVPSVSETLPGFDAVGWLGLVAPARTPAPILDKLSAEIQRQLATEEMKARLAALAFVPVGGSRDTFARYIRAEVTKWSEVVQAAGIKPEQ